MKRSRSQIEALTIGQLARRWGVSRDRIQNLINEGRIPGVFQIPAAGRFASAVKVPLQVIKKIELDWTLSPPLAKTTPTKPPKYGAPAFKNFPELNPSLEPDVGSPEGEGR